ncbi:unnamed protein product [Oppiella nova]|uniref:EB domain-containing protein n=1 Tax=Oppiella nova TaxID=334625 RepID=A0A7R9LX35_9ACAR|nr:unnamed protein product [Oppiella nova]CAG2167790.1 unnamed protein product [Oppiella nova]
MDISVGGTGGGVCALTLSVCVSLERAQEVLGQCAALWRYFSALNSNNNSGIIVRNVFVNTNYKLTWINFTTSANDTGPDGSDGGVAQLEVSLPPQLRHRQQQSLPTRIRLEVVGSAASVRIRDAGAMHQGFYSAYKVLTHPNSSDQYVADRKDFYIYIKGLGDENDGCSENSTCISQHCLYGRCVCNGDKPVLNDHKCHSAQPIGSKCLHSSQCQWIAGPNAHCNYKGKCRCARNAIPIQIPIYGKYCIEPKVFNDSCIYSEECLLIGTNRYCNEQFKCQCHPGYHYHMGVGCINRPYNHVSPLQPSTTFIWLILVFTFVATIL